MYQSHANMMAQQRGFWSSLFSSQPKQQRPFTSEELHRLHTILTDCTIVTKSNLDTVIEALRFTAELVIWGDQHDPTIIEYFLEQNMLAQFANIITSNYRHHTSNTTEKADDVIHTEAATTVMTQVLQTLSILIQNIKTQQTIYCLFSNNHINDIVALSFNFEDDELLGYYVNLLKTISLKLNETTVQLFFKQPHGVVSPKIIITTSNQKNDNHSDSSDSGSSFPLYTEAIKFASHKDGMVRTAVRTITLNVYAIQDPAVQAYITSSPASQYFARISEQLKHVAVDLDNVLQTSNFFTTNNNNSTANSISLRGQASVVESRLADIEDILSYCGDILATNVEEITKLVVHHLMEDFLYPIIIHPIAGGHTYTGINGSRVGPLCSLYLLERLIYCLAEQQQHEHSKTILDQVVGQLFPDVVVDMIGNDDDDNVHISAAVVRVFVALYSSRDNIDRLGLGPTILATSISNDDDVVAEEKHHTTTSRVVRALLKVLGGKYASPIALGMSGWLLTQLIVVPVPPEEGREDDNKKSEKWWEVMAQQAIQTRQQALHATITPSISNGSGGGGMWCDALLPMITEEWKKANILLSLSSSSVSSSASSLHSAALTWMQAASLQELQWELVEDPDSVAASSVSVSAKLAWLAASSMAIVFQTIDRILPHSATNNNIKGNELASSKGSSKEPPCPVVTVEDIKKNEPQPKSIIPMYHHHFNSSRDGVDSKEEERHPDDEEMKCVVAFSAGEEITVHLVIQGLPPHLSAGQASPTHLTRLKSEAIREIAAATPWALVLQPLADRLHTTTTTNNKYNSSPISPGSTTTTIPSPIINDQKKKKKGEGRIVSVAPLLGCSSYRDKDQGHWLHVEVRPTVSRILNILYPSSSSTMHHNHHSGVWGGGDEMILFGSGGNVQLKCGHWVLSFEDEKGAEVAEMRLKEAAELMTGVYRYALNRLFDT